MLYTNVIGNRKPFKATIIELVILKSSDFIEICII